MFTNKGLIVSKAESLNLQKRKYQENPEKKRQSVKKGDMMIRKNL